MKTTLLYPVTNQSAPIIRYWRTFFPNEKLVLSTFYGTGLAEKNVGYAMGYSSPNTIVLGDNDILEIAKHTDKIVLLPLNAPYRVLDISKTFSALENLCYKYNIELLDYRQTTLDLSDIYEYQERTSLRDIPVPVVFVGGLSDDSFVLDTFLSVISGLISQNISVAAFSDKISLKMIGCHYLPNAEQMRSNLAEHSIKSLNKYVGKIISTHQTNVAVFHISSPLVIYNSLITGDFCSASYELSQAIPPDYIIMTLPLNLAEKDIVCGISHECERLYKQKINSVVFENTIIDPIATFGKGEIKKIIIDGDLLCAKQFGSDVISNVHISKLTDNDVDIKLANQIINDLPKGDENE